jgi:glycosyltransferase involved in cell wall biosynthesis
MNDRLVINLSILMQKPTGHSVYINNVVPKLIDLNPALLINEAMQQDWHDRYPDFQLHSVPNHLNPDRGSMAYLRRLLWTQFRLPARVKKLGGRLLFSPIPELPIGSKIPGVVTLYDFIPLRFSRRRSPLHQYNRHYVPRVLKQAKHIIAISESTANDAMKFCNVPASKITAIPLGYDSTNFRFLDLPTQNYVLYLGRTNPYKNVRRAIQAFSQVPHHQDYEFWIAGPADPRYIPELEGLAWELGVRLQILNYVPYPELPILINRAIALVFPSLWEGFGLPILEAMACGTPVITSNTSSMPEVAGDAAILVDPTDVNAIAGAIADVIRDDRLRQQLRDRGLARSQTFSWERTGEQTMALLADLGT